MSFPRFLRLFLVGSAGTTTAIGPGMNSFWRIERFGFDLTLTWFFPSPVTENN
jgi:hypothetical protein